MALSWTQPKCNRCAGNTQVVKIVPEHRDLEKCAWCGEETMSGIYVRADPSTVKFPREKES